MKVRKPAVAGVFYPSHAQTLKDTLEKLVGGTIEWEGSPIGGISPHAGYIYSGKTVGKLYACFKNTQGSKFLILGPSHFFPIKRVSFPTWDFFQTPLGLVEVDQENIEEFLKENSKYYNRDNYPHLYEHSIEVQIPFLQYISNDVKIVPATFGQVDPTLIKKLIEWFVSKGYRFIISSDLSHYYSDEEARRLDTYCHRGILEKDLKSISMCQACGKEGIEGALLFAMERGLKTYLLDYTTSADVSGDRDSVVGYGAYLFTS